MGRGGIIYRWNKITGDEVGTLKKCFIGTSRRHGEEDINQHLGGMTE